MRNEENSTQVFSSEQLKTVQDMIGENEPSLFSVLQELSKKYDEKTTIYLTKEFCLNCQSYENQRVGMEFLYTNGFFKDLEELIRINENSSYSLNNDWGRLYKVQLKWKKFEINGDELLNFLDKFNSDDHTLSCLIVFLRIYGHYDLYEYEKIELFQDKLTKSLLYIDNTLIRIYFQLRENEMFFHYHWKRNEVEVARNYAHNILDNIFNPGKKCYTHLILAETYVFEDYDKAMEHANEGIKIAKNYNLDYFVKVAYNKLIPFISAINGVYENITTSDEVEKAHLLLAEGKCNEALDILRLIKEPTPFQEYYLGIALQDEQLLKKSYNRFIFERKDKFFAKLPNREILKRGWNQNEKENSTYN